MKSNTVKITDNIVVRKGTIFSYAHDQYLIYDIIFEENKYICKLWRFTVDINPLRYLGIKQEFLNMQINNWTVKKFKEGTYKIICDGNIEN